MEKKEEKEERNKWIKNVISLVGLFFCAELFQKACNYLPELQIIDMRLIFVLIISSYMGIKFGILSAILSSLAYCVQNYNSDIYSLILNTTNWIPIAIYIIFSIIIGQEKDKTDLKLSKNKEKIDQLNNQNKENEKTINQYERKMKEFNKVLMTHKNSYVQIATFIKTIRNATDRINKIETEISNMLEANTTLIDIYSKDAYIYKKQEVMDKISQNDVWVNTTFESNMPNVIAPIFIKGEIKFLIVVKNCNFEQMNIDFKNEIIAIANIVSDILELI